MHIGLESNITQRVWATRLHRVIGLLWMVMWQCMFQAQLFFKSRQPPNPINFPYITAILLSDICHRRFAPTVELFIRTMASTSAQAASPPPSRPASPHPTSTNQRNDEVAGDESAPLLANQAPPSAGVVSSRIMHILTSSALTSAVFTLLFLIVIIILMSALPYGYQVPYETSNAFSAVVVPVRHSDALSPWHHYSHGLGFGFHTHRCRKPSSDTETPLYVSLGYQSAIRLSDRCVRYPLRRQRPEWCY